MKTQIILVLLAASIFQFSIAGTVNCPTTPCGANLYCKTIGTHTGAACTAADPNDICATGYSDVNTGTPTSGAAVADCTICATDYFLDAVTAEAKACVAKASGKCLTGYSDVDGKAASSPLTGNC